MNIADSLTVDTNLTYCPLTLNVNQPLNITNVSQQDLVFKVKTNKKNFISMNPCNGFIKPFTTLSIPVKIVEHVPENVSIKLQVDWALATPQMRQKNDIKMSNVDLKDIHKKIFPIIRAYETVAKVAHESMFNNMPISNKDLLPEVKKVEEVQKKITPFEYENKAHEIQPAAIESHKKYIQPPQKKLEQSHKKVEPYQIKQKAKPQEVEVADDVFQYRSANNLLSSISSPSKGLEIVSQQDEEDHEKELEQIKNKQIEQIRKIDEIKSKARKLNQEIKSTEIIDPKLLTVALIGSYLIGSFVQYLVF